MDLNSIKRKELVKILAGQGINDKKVLFAINKVKREFFVNDEFKSRAYDNNALPIAGNQTISQPFTVAFMTQLLEVKPGDKVLEIGTGSGYQAAVLCELGAKVFSVERVSELAVKTDKLLKSLGYNVKIKTGDGSKGWIEYAPFEKIIVTAGSPQIPKSLLDQLAIGGLIVIPVGDQFTQIMTLIKKVSENDEIKFKQKKFDEYKFVPLIGAEGWT
ncbi:MAG TPA: protein-L-isoaspartate O-methyltransferase [Bacteroidetes bacterium]|nr:protein-L-isoaspartate(D-aspartate) O-methyltransferase [Ignavibacteria bacterium]HCA43147.1 protein-L-isoaspartate O-methyltransferase [Bacteroidota bacterium]HCN36529.1 protein-L-isoaspartate O-methyltransferase [Bacteroidota bacterium]